MEAVHTEHIQMLRIIHLKEAAVGDNGRRVGGPMAGTEPLKSQDPFNLTGLDDHRVTCKTRILRFLVKLVHP